MKKIKKVIALVLAGVILFGGVVFGNDPVTPTPITTDASFTVTTEIASVNSMKVTTAPVVVGTTGYDDLDDFTDFGVTSSNLNTGSAIAYLSTQTNNRNGYKISLTVTAMKSTPTSGAVSYINYTIFLGADTAGQKTDDGTAKTKSDVIQQGALTKLTETSYPIKITVDADEYAAAVEGSYTGTVTFNYVAN